MDKKTSIEKDFKYLDNQRLKSIQKTFDLLGIKYDSNYPGATQFSKNLKKISNLSPEQYQLRTSNSSV